MLNNADLEAEDFGVSPEVLRKMVGVSENDGSDSATKLPLFDSRKGDLQNAQQFCVREPKK